jgi:hypothetical protein
MSFDLFVLVERFDNQSQSARVERLGQVGVSCVFPPGFRLDRIDEETPPIVCTLGPPLVAARSSPESVGFAVESADADAEDVAGMKTGTDAELARKLKAAKFEFHFSSGAGRDDVSLIVQCYGAAALADVANGVLVDPQEAGAVHGDAVYAVARANSQFVIDAPGSPLAPAAQE